MSTNGLNPVILGGVVIRPDTPVGAILMWPTATPPTNWLILNGSVYSSVTYPDLFAVLGTTTLPDLRQRFPLGVAAAGTGSTLLGTGGTINHTHDVNIPPFTSGNNNQTANTNLVLPGGVSTHNHTIDPPNTTSTTANPPFLALHFIIKAA